jgi:hypothetical protein
VKTRTKVEIADENKGAFDCHLGGLNSPTYAVVSD